MMNIILLSKNGKTRRLDLSRPVSLLLAFLLIGSMTGSLLYGGYRFAEMQLADKPLQEIENFQAELDRQRAVVEAVRQEARENLNALSVRLGQMNAHVIRLDALGDRLTRMADIDQDEFNFAASPAQGGPESTDTVEAESLPQLLTAMDEVQRRIDDREAQLSVLENLMMSRNLQNQVTPAGRPIRSGWLSSYFGVRTDPFTGKRARHYGLDFAGAEGSDVVATGAGVVTYAGSRYGYGNMVEINHGNGFVTRYAHNKEILVKVGDVVKKGQTVGHMGSSGRSTGPHVHFEVLQDGKVVNPLKYIQD